VGRRVKTLNIEKSCNIGESNGQWKGDKVSYRSLHHWVRYHLMQPETCSKCKEKNDKLDIANISGDYKRDLSDWEWLCRSCHMKKDGRLNQLMKR